MARTKDLCYRCGKFQLSVYEYLMMRRQGDPYTHQSTSRLRLCSECWNEFYGWWINGRSPRGHTTGVGSGQKSS